jgi:DNA repair exonuclease SbcCD ATPase subunit
MIKQLKLIRFRSHDDATLNFTPGVNVIVGDSDSGKSNIVRGLRWQRFNRPSGFSMRSHWAKGSEATEVTTALSEGVGVTRFRNNTKNEYRLSTLSEPLEAVRTDVPSPVCDVLRMDDVNMQRQGDKPYLLDESPPEVARILNAIAGLDGIDEAHTRIAGKIKENQDTTRALSLRTSELENQLIAFEGVDDLQERIVQYNAKEEQLQTASACLANLEEVIREAEEIACRYDKTSNAPSLWAQGGALSKKWVEIKTTHAMSETIGTLAAAVAALQSGLTTIEKLFHAASGRDAAIDVMWDLIEKDERTLRQLEMALLPTYFEMRDYLKATEGYKVFADRLAETTAVFENFNKQNAEFTLLTLIGKTVSALEARIADNGEAERIMKELKAFGGCPTCGSAAEHWKMALI